MAKCRFCGMTSTAWGAHEGVCYACDPPNKPVTDGTVEEAKKLRQTGIYTMREIANRLNVNRDELIEAFQKAGWWR
jgi:hypothetical protein